MNSNSDNVITTSRAEQDAYDELQCYTLAHPDPAFPHQHVVDAWAAQHADERTKPIGLTFALIGLCLHLEQGFSGRQVQRVHMLLGQRKRTWPSFTLPGDRGDVTVIDVIKTAAGPDRDRMIDRWCASVWETFHESHGVVRDVLRQHGITGD